MYVIEVVTVSGNTIYVNPDAQFREPDGTNLLGNLDRRSHEEVRPGRLARQVETVALQITDSHGTIMPDMLFVRPASHLTVSAQAMRSLDQANLRWDPDLVRIPGEVTFRARRYEYCVLFPSRRHAVLDINKCDVEYYSGTQAIKKIRRHVLLADLPPFDLIRGIEANEWYCTDNWREGWTGASLTGLQFHPL